MWPEGASHISTVRCLMLYIKENLFFNKTTRKIQHSENTMCKLSEKYIIDKLDIMHEHLFS